ncbi:hypothetical protein [Saccharothrix obliqua]|uniref:hypothetical protein n=1 Tax=Saccharothrix obliqua TaxID=2861747 RepID=UPI001C5F5E65|nr:hypothetical protein [Saccharothrix obliqua]MBW4722287.1 hypothetical protein [Saccharothrix obliqua]
MDTLDSVGHSHAAFGQHIQARAIWREAFRLYRDHGRDTDAERARRQLDDLDSTPTSVKPSQDAMGTRPAGEAESS